MLPLFALCLTALATTPALSPAPASFGPPWISIELPANPWNREAPNAFLLVRALHHSTPADSRVTGVAEGRVNGERRSLKLTLRPTGQTGVYYATNQWGEAGEWVLLFTVEEGDNSVAQAVVRVSHGEVVSVKVPTTTNRHGDVIPRRLDAQEIEAALRS